MPKKIDLTGQPFGRLVVIRENGRKNGRVTWLCRCLGRQGDDCGNEVVVTTSDLRSGNTQSCGCLQRERCTTHGCCNEPWFPTYSAMMKRCGHWEGASERSLRDYRDRGITVCEEWRNSPKAFGDWLLAHGWRKGLEIDRIDNSKGYSPDNCQVVTSKENSNNRRNTLRLDDGMPLAMFCTSLGIETLEEGKITKQYGRIQSAWRHGHKPHPELIQALKEDIDKQSRLLSETARRRKELEVLIIGLKKLATSKQTV